MIFFYRFFAALALLVFSVLYIGLIVSVIIGISGSVLRTIGLTQIEIIFPPDISLPAYLSIPIMFVFTTILLIISKYVKQIIRFLLLPF
ncbi:hypothetical protein [Virgibacillus dokdonensis]|nr:hypothetical protein [Virgibacillus dokdonensis]